jgi:hypothetical protein
LGGNIGSTLVHIHFWESEIGNLSNHFGWKKDVARFYITVDDGMLATGV